MATESWVVAGPQIIEVEQVSALRVQVVAGRVDVVAHEDAAERGARIEVHSVTGRPLEVSLSDGELRVGYGVALGGWEGLVDRVRNVIDKDAVDVHVAVPRDAGVKLGTVSADGLLAGVQHDATVSTVSGGLVTDSTRGSLSVNAVSGDVVVRDHVGSIGLNTVSGDVTVSGDLARVQANSVSGAVTIDAEAGTSSVSVTTVSGDATVRVPDGRGLVVEARSLTGRVVVDGTDYKTGNPGRARVDLRDGDGSCFVTSSTVSGHLTVLHAARA